MNGSDLSHFSSRVRMILVETSHPGNIGAAARAMKNMGLSQLDLVNPHTAFPHPEATARASGATDILEHARIFQDLDEALHDVCWVVATSARVRDIRWTELSPRSMAPLLRQKVQEGPVAILFGPERSGLSNAHLQKAAAQLVIPSDPMFSSLNVASALQIIAYEIRMALSGSDSAPSEAMAPDPLAASQRDLEGMYTHLKETLHMLEVFHPQGEQALMARIRRMFGRCALRQDEIRIIRGVCRQILKMKG